MSDALKAYEFVSENVPSWIEMLHGLQQKIKERQGHANRVQVPARTLKKSGSNESIRPTSIGGGCCGEGENMQLDIMSAPQQHDISPEAAAQHLAPPSRKRKTASLISNDSIATKFRTRSMIIVFYDSEIQQTFELVVRNIGTARNQLRRARTTLQMNALINGRDAPPTNYNQPSFGTPSSISSLPPFRSSRAPRRERTPSQMPSSTQSTNLASADAALEKAQSLCEKGAHQFLRDGDCEADIIGTKESFEEAKRIAEEELESLKQEMEASQAEEYGSDRRQKLGPQIQGFLAAGPIEIDSDHDDGGEVDDPIMKLARYQPPRRPGAPLSVPA